MYQNEKIVFSIQLVNFLGKKGIVYKKRMPDLKKPEFDCFVYDYTPELDQAIGEYVNQKKNK